MKMVKMKTGLMILFNEIPDDFMAVSSYRSAKFPNAMLLLNSMAKGKASGIMVSET